MMARELGRSNSVRARWVTKDCHAKTAHRDTTRETKACTWDSAKHASVMDILTSAIQKPARAETAETTPTETIANSACPASSEMQHQADALLEISSVNVPSATQREHLRAICVVELATANQTLSATAAISAVREHSDFPRRTNWDVAIASVQEQLVTVQLANITAMKFHSSLSTSKMFSH